ncbi:hypothetical protein ACG33_14715 [Steroidobacter denitrificans]|uniref:Cytochrome c domain-containing protein n=1 Tax=Steroidobacter denitrificans TaxID=465721 RepID=A0A127FD55_STEDE|nr:hypothetical protein ACG33_14715 [Steroidobacter denitrificans]
MLVVVALLLIGLARFVGKKQYAVTQADPAVEAAIAERIAPVAKLAIAGEDNSALVTPDQPAEPEQPVQQAAAPAEGTAGKETYNMACVACHGAGIAGAPKYGDAAVWAPRIAKGMDTLHKHAIEGFHGDAGFMPAKGGRVDLSDQVVMDAVDYMVAGSK